MSIELIKYAYVAGELSPTLYGRSDLDKFDLGLAAAANWFVDYRGGISTRPGQEFCDYIKADDQGTKTFRWKFNSDIANTYVLLFGHLYLRFLQDGGYVLEASKAVTGCTAGIITAVAHGYSNGDWIKHQALGGITNLEARSVVVRNVTANTYTLEDVFGNVLVPTGVYTAGGTVSRIYTVVSPYAASDLEDLTCNQLGDFARLTHSAYDIYNLNRLAATSWTLTAEALGSIMTAPSGLTGTPSAAGAAGFAWGVTSVDKNGNESVLSTIFLETASVNFTVTAGTYKYKWTPVTGAAYYNIYRSAVLITGTQITRGAQVGYLGRTDGALFVDTNIVPDFTKTPPEHNDPFADGAVDTISVTAGGAGYTAASTVSLTTGTGSGFLGVPIVDVAAGTLIGVKILSRGQDYLSTDTFVFTVGAGATVTFTLTPASGNKPGQAATHQQRQVYAATLNQPLTIFGSRIGKRSNFDGSQIVADSDSFQFDLDSEEITPIRHMIAVRGGLMLMTDSNIFLLSGGGTNTPLTATNALSEPQSYTGVNKVPPLKVDTDLIFCDDNGQVVRMLSYSEFSKIYSGTDVSILSNHLFGPGKNVTSWSYAAAPHKFVWAVREDGVALAFTTVKEQNVFGWTRSSTRGKYLDVLSVKENSLDSVYFTVQRKINGRMTKFIERQASRIVDDIEEMMCLDCALMLPPTFPAFDAVASAATGMITVSGGFVPGDVGKIIRLGGGKGAVTAYLGGGAVTVVLVKDISDVISEDPGNRPNTAASGTWTLDVKVSVITGLWHLENETVKALVDGSVVEDLIVTDGSVTLPFSGSRIIIGIPYRCILQTLPLIAQQGVLEGKRKRVVAVAARVSDTRGLSAGPTLDKLYDMKERTNELWGEPTRVINGVKYQLLATEYNTEGQVYIIQDNPLPATILGHVISAEVGDDDS